MYSRKSWGGQIDPFILVRFENETTEGEGSNLVGLIIYEYQDQHLIGKYPPGEDPLLVP